MQRNLIGWMQCFVLLAFLVQPVLAIPPETDWSKVIAQGISLRQQGDFQQSIDALTLAHQSADSREVKAQAAGELGISLLQAHRYEPSEAPLQQAHAYFTGTERARYSVYLGNLAVIRKRPSEARNYFSEALKLAGGDIAVRLSVGLNLTRLSPESGRLAQLEALSSQLDKAAGLQATELSRFHLNLGNQARQSGSKGLALAYHHLDRSRELASDLGNKRLQVDALDTLAQLYEDQARSQDAMRLTRQAISLAYSLDQGSIADLLINLEWRQARLLKDGNRISQALAAYQRAVSLIESVRQDIPIEYEDGRSSFRTTLEPVYLGYADLMLQQLDQHPPETREKQLRQIVNTIELIKQTEMQDFLGDRCSVESVQGEGALSVPSGVAILYPLILPDRIELLLETNTGIARQTTRVKNATLRDASSQLADSLRNGLFDYKNPARQLHDWLIKPFEQTLKDQKIQSLVVVPEGVLRLVPIAALHDGKQFLIEKYAVSMVTGMSMTNTTASVERKLASLVVGLSEPGPVVEKLSRAAIAQVLDPKGERKASTRGLAHDRTLRSTRLRSSETLEISKGNATRSAVEVLRESLTLPGVKEEVQSLNRILGGTRMLDASFTVDGFQQEAAAGAYRIVHIASHGVFGGSANASYIMAYDDLLTLDGLQSLLKSDKFRKTPIELLSLSACETAEGDERSPLGISGAAMKARAKSVLGTLWPVEDNAARKTMEKFYGGLTAAHLSKTEALRQAQIELLRNDDFAHPFFWAPFVLIGNWL